MAEWKKEYPNEPGQYWLYGFLDYEFENQEGHPHKGKPYLCFVEVKPTPTGFVYITKGRFAYTQEFRGVFQKVELPELPTDVSFE